MKHSKNLWRNISRKWKDRPAGKYWSISAMILTYKLGSKFGMINRLVSMFCKKQGASNWNLFVLTILENYSIHSRQTRDRVMLVYLILKLLRKYLPRVAPMITFHLMQKEKQDTKEVFPMNYGLDFGKKLFVKILDALSSS